MSANSGTTNNPCIVRILNATPEICIPRLLGGIPVASASHSEEANQIARNAYRKFFFLARLELHKLCGFAHLVFESRRNVSIFECVKFKPAAFDGGATPANIHQHVIYRPRDGIWGSGSRSGSPVVQEDLAYDEFWPELQNDVFLHQRSSFLGRVSSLRGFLRLGRNSQKGQENSPSCRSVGPSEEAIPTWRVPFGIGYVFLAMLGIRFGGDDATVKVCSFLCALLGGAFILNGYVNCQSEYHREHEQVFQHNSYIVPHKHLTPYIYWGTVIDMANALNTDKRIAVIGALAEGSSIRSIERITGVHRDTIMRLGVKVGQGCAAVMDSKMRNLPCHRLEMDEIWGFVGKKERNVRVGEDAVGSVWTFCAIDAETKLVPAFKVGDRSAATAKAFVQDVADRMAYRVQISTDGLNAYVAAMESAFGGNVDYAQIIKTYGREETTDNRRYSAPEFVSSEKIIHVGNPDVRFISTSYIERLNATTRLHMRRLTRLTLAFSKKRENFEAAVALHFAYYNFVKRHNTLRCTPAMAAGIANSFWSIGDLVEAAS